MNNFITFLLFLLSSKYGDGKRHNISLKDDGRQNFPLSTFGFFKGGRLLIDIKKFSINVPKDKWDTFEKDHLLDSNFGFSLQRTTNDGISSYMEKTSKKCLLMDQSLISMDMKILLFKFNMRTQNITVERNGDKEFNLIKVFDTNSSKMELTVSQWLRSHVALMPFQSKDKCDSLASTNVLHFRKTETVEDKQHPYFSGKFTVGVNCSAQSGLYNLYFHNCINYVQPNLGVTVNLELHMVEHNVNTFLSAGEMPLPIMYGFMSCAFFSAGCIWTAYLRKARMWTYKIHWLMVALVYLKSISVGFHAINYYYTGKEGLHVQTWAVLYYVIHLLKGALLFTTIVLIGTGYFFVKHVLSSKEKKLFMTVIPLQIIANVAQVIIESTEEGNASYKTWSQMALLVDLICCGAILLPVVWSIKHLSEAAKTDGKAAISLQKLKLFRQFYVMIVVYIYFTRIIVYLIKITVPFQYMWLDELFTEAATYFFFVLTGYKFRPVNNNPYLHLVQEEPEEDIEMNDISVHSSFSEKLTRVNKADTQARTT